MFHKAKQYFEKKEYYLATSWLERMFKNYPASSQRREALIIITKAYDITGRDEKAEHYLDILRQEFPDAASSMEAEYRKQVESVPPPTPLNPDKEDPTARSRSLFDRRPNVSPAKPVKPVEVAKQTEVVRQPASSAPSSKPKAPLPVPAQTSAGSSAPVMAAQAEKKNLTSPINAAAPVTVPTTAPVAPASSAISPPGSTLAIKVPPPTPVTGGNTPEQKPVAYTLSSGETENRSTLNILLKELTASGFQPIIWMQNKTSDAYRLVTECFNAKSAAQKRQAALARQNKHAFIMQEADQFCVVAASFFSYDAALTEQERFKMKGLATKIIKTQVKIPTWKITTGRYNDSLSATTALKRLAEKDINLIIEPLDK
jgi:hypothetical protein